MIFAGTAEAERGIATATMAKKLCGRGECACSPIKRSMLKIYVPLPN